MRGRRLFSSALGRCVLGSVCLCAVLFVFTLHSDFRSESTAPSLPERFNFELHKAAVPKSLCLTIEGYEVRDTSPTRSPLIVADHLIEHSRGKVIFEIGTRNGDILDCVSRHAAHAYSVEIVREYCDVLEARGLTVLCQDVMKVNISDLPHIPDVFFWWPMKAQTQNEMWLEYIREQLGTCAPGNRTAIIAFDHKWKNDVDSKVRMLSVYPDAEEFILDFAEGTEWRAHGTFSLVHFSLP